MCGRVSLSTGACDPQTLQALAGDTNLDVRIAVGHNPSCGPDVLKTLAGDGFVGVRATAASHRWLWC